MIAEGTEKQPSKRAFLPDEFMKNKLKIDQKWYLTQQLLPPISRLIDPLNGIDSVFLAECFGVEQSHFVHQTASGETMTNAEKF